MSVHFLYFFFNEKELNQQVCLIKYVENEISNSTPPKKKKIKKKSNFKNISKTPEKFSLVTLVTNYHKYHFYHFWSDPDENLKNNNWY